MVNAQNEIVDVKDMAFEKAKAQVAHLYPNLDMRELDLFKFVKDAQVVNEVDG